MNRQELSPDIRALWEDPLSRDEFDKRVRASLEHEESIAENIELIDWFLRRYPTAEARLAYARRKYREAVRRTGIWRLR